MNKLIGMRNIGGDRSVCGVIIPDGALIKPAKVDALMLDEAGNLIAPPEELDRFLSDWPASFEVEKEATPAPKPAAKPKSAPIEGEV